jgi:hypothetical protein
MGYESKLYVMNEKEYPYPEDYNGEKDGYNQTIAVFDMGCMPMNFKSIFTEDLKYPLYDESDEIITEDKYGDKPVKADIKPVIDYLYNLIQTDDYRRLKPLYAFLTALQPEQWDNLIVIHYGY